MEADKKNEYKISLGRNVRFFRQKALGLTQNQFVEQVGLSQGFISDIEKGKKIPGGEFFITLLEKWNVNLHFLLRGEGEIFNFTQEDEKGTYLGNRFKQVRLENRYREEEFAHLLTIEVNELVTYEKNLQTPPEVLLLVLVHRFDLDLKWLKQGGPRKALSSPEWEEKLREGIRDENEIERMREEFLQLENRCSTQDNIIHSLKETISSQKDLLGLLRENAQLSQKEVLFS